MFQYGKLDLARFIFDTAAMAATTQDGVNLIVKLPRHRAEQLIAAGTGKPFAPAGRTFREWVLIGDRDPRRWAELIDEASAFAAGKP